MSKETKKVEPTVVEQGSRKRIKFERTFEAPLDDIWNLWTTKEGLESWWGPEGFATSVRKLDIRPRGTFEYSMTAMGPDQIEALKSAGIPLTSFAHGVYTEVAPRRRLAYKTVADFIPGVTPYDVATEVEFDTGPRGVRMIVTEDTMHDEQWTQMSMMGMNSSLDKLTKVLETRHVHD